MKKILILFLCCFPIFTKAKDAAIFTLESNTDQKNLQINLHLENNPGFSILEFKITFDPTALEDLSAKINGLETAILKGITKKDEKAYVGYVITLEEEGLMLENGIICSLEFQVKEELKKDSIQIEILHFQKNEQTKLDYQVKNSLLELEIVKELDEQTEPKNESETNKESQEDPTSKEQEISNERIIEDKRIEEKKNPKITYILSPILLISITSIILIKKRKVS